MEAGHRYAHPKHKPQNSGVSIVLRDVLLLVAAMLLFALFHHVIPMKLTPVSETAAYQAASPAPQLTADPALQ